ncbi:hypothetical protein GCM10009608_50750 [Pseudonocardia alaniniphila]
MTSAGTRLRLLVWPLPGGPSDQAVLDTAAGCVQGPVGLRAAGADTDLEAPGGRVLAGEQALFGDLDAGLGDGGGRPVTEPRPAAMVETCGLDPPPGPDRQSRGSDV